MEIRLKEGEEIKVQAADGHDGQNRTLVCYKNCILTKGEVKALKPKRDVLSLKKGERVKCISIDGDQSYGGCDLASLYLSTGCIYTIEKVEIHSWHTKIHLQEYPKRVFNSVLFEFEAEEE